MTAPTVEAESTNAAYLSAALRWLRLRFTRLDRSGDVDQSLPADNDPTDPMVEMRTTAAARPTPALPDIAARFNLSAFETNLLLLCAAMELDPDTPARCTGPNGTRPPYPTLALALQLFEGSTWDYLSPSYPLRYMRLIEVDTHDQPLLTSALRLTESTANRIKGLRQPDAAILQLLLPLPAPWAPAAVPVSRLSFMAGASHLTEPETEPTTHTDGTVSALAVTAALPASYLPALDRVIAAFSEPTGPHPNVQLVGPDPTGRLLVAQAAAEAMRLTALRLPATQLLTAPDETVSRAWARDSTLYDICAVIDAEDLPAENAAQLSHLLVRMGTGALITARHPLPLRTGSDIVVDVPYPTVDERRAWWRSVLPADHDETALAMATNFPLDPITIDRIAAGHEPIPDADLSTSLGARCRTVTSQRGMGGGTGTWSHPSVGWNDLVLPDAQTAQLRQVVRRARHRVTVLHDWGYAGPNPRGLGNVALFAGASGTGKTLAAEVLAAELHVDLCHVDLATVVSKYIGETEKNLARLFDTVEQTSAVLFFDEADALFGKRAQVRDSHDRYANIETSYLLQRLETHSGIVILATNMADNLDSGFRRRIQTEIIFPFPAVGQRRLIWQTVIPADAPVDPTLDLTEFADIPASGATIRNIALHAAYLAADDPTSRRLSRRHLIAAAQAELGQSGRALPGTLADAQEKQCG